MDAASARDLFRYHAPGKLAWKHEALSTLFLDCLAGIERIIPDSSAEKTLAIRALHVAKMQASAAVAIHEHPTQEG